MERKPTRGLACAVGEPLTDAERTALMGRLRRKAVVAKAAWKLQRD